MFGIFCSLGAFSLTVVLRFRQSMYLLRFPTLFSDLKQCSSLVLYVDKNDF